MACDSTSLDALIDHFGAPSPFWGHLELDIRATRNHDNECGVPRCSICGIHIIERVQFPGDYWHEHALLIGDLSREYEYVQTNRKYPASFQNPAVFEAEITASCSRAKGCDFFFTQDVWKHYYFPYAADVDSFNGGPDGKNVVYIPMHKVCFHIALRSPRLGWDETSSTRLRVLFRVLRHRFQVNWEHLLRRFPGAHDDHKIDWPERYVAMNTIGFQNDQGIERGYFSKKCLDVNFWRQESHYLMHDPENIPSLTDTLLKNLESRAGPQGTKQTKAFKRHLRRLPNELQLLIYEYLVQDQEWPLECTRMLSPQVWKALFNKENPCMEWLWDLDFELIRQTDPNLNMDWELLFRKLSQRPKIANCLREYADSDYEIFRGVLDHVPPGLEGRRRIWILVDEMRVGDRSTRWELDTGHDSAGIRYETVPDMAEVPVYWNSDGEPLNEEELGAL